MNDLQTSEEEFRQNALNYLKQFLYSGPIEDTSGVTTSNFSYCYNKYVAAYDLYGYDLVPQKKELGEQIEELIQKLENVNKI